MSSFKEHIGCVIEDNLKYKEMLEIIISSRSMGCYVCRCSEPECNKIGMKYTRCRHDGTYIIKWVGEELYHALGCFNIYKGMYYGGLWCKEHYTPIDAAVRRVVFDNDKESQNYNYCQKCVSLFQDQDHKRCKIITDK